MTSTGEIDSKPLYNGEIYSASASPIFTELSTKVIKVGSKVSVIFGVSNGFSALFVIVTV